MGTMTPHDALAAALHEVDARQDVGPVGHDPMCEVRAETILAALSDAGYVLVKAEGLEAASYLRGIDACINIVEQSLATVRSEDDGESRSITTSIAAREHVVALLSGYRAATLREEGGGS